MKFTFIDYLDVSPYTCDTPYNQGLGGTQSAICYYAETLASQGHEVVVYLQNGATESTVRSVSFKPLVDLLTPAATKETTDVAIFCSGVSKVSKKVLKDRLVAALTICWIPHNTNERAVDDLPECLYTFDVFAFVSDWQRKKYVELYGIEINRTILMLNGVSPAFLGDIKAGEKKPIFLYTTQPCRGLEVVAAAWPRIVEAWPEAELHTYSSRKLYGHADAPEAVALLTSLRELPRVEVKDPVGQAELAAVSKQAAFFAYPANVNETGCIVLMEAGASGCIPIVSDLGALGTYFDTCLTFNDSLVDQFVEQANSYMELYTNNRTKFIKQSERVAAYYQQTRNYSTIIEQFIEDTVRIQDLKQKSKERFALANASFEAGDYNKTHLYLENMIPFFSTAEHVHLYFLWLGISHYYKESYNNAVTYFERSHKYGNSLQLCVNLILSYEKLNNQDKVLYWCEEALKFKFDVKIVHKVLDIVQKRPYFDRCKWGRYLVSLWNDDIQNADWLSLFLSHGNMVIGDYTLVMKHEEGMELNMNLIQKALAHSLLYKTDLSRPCVMRGNLEKLFSNLFLNMNYCETNNPKLWSYVDYFMKHLPPLTIENKPRFEKIIRGSRKLRIGFLTGDLVYHPVSYILNGIVTNFDKSRFETHIFSTTPVKDDVPRIQTRIRNDATAFYDLAGKPMKTIVDTIAEADIDVLIEMTGHTSNAGDLLNVARHKPARVLANYFAYPNTYGVETYDYKIGDKHVFPLGLDQYYTESFCKIEGGFHTYKPIVDLEVNKLPHEGIIFGCTNNPKKYRPAWIKTVSRILKEVPDSRLKMRYFNLEDPSIREFYWKEFEKNGVDRERIDLDLGRSLETYFESYADMDICLDPFPYNGGTINIETLYAGIPYITLAGNNYVSRVGASILHQVGHPELIAKNEDAYVNLATTLAKDAPRLQKYKDTLREDMMKSTLGDNTAFTRRFEDACEWMLEEKKWFIGPRRQAAQPKLHIYE